MVIAFPHNQIKILDYNRVLKSKLSNEKIINGPQKSNCITDIALSPSLNCINTQ